MVPAVVVVLGRFPLTPSGKADRAALPGPEFDGLAAGRAPATMAAEVICSLFAEVLGVERAGPGDSFFDLGAGSVLSMQLVARARRGGPRIRPARARRRRARVRRGRGRRGGCGGGARGGGRGRRWGSWRWRRRGGRRAGWTRWPG